MGLAPHDHVVKTLTSDRADRALDITVLPWRSRRDRAVANAHRPNPPREGGVTFEAVHDARGRDRSAGVSCGWRRPPRACLRNRRGCRFKVLLHPCSRTRRTGGPAGVSSSYDCSPRRHVRSRRRPIRHARRPRPAASGAAADWRRSHPTAASFCGRRGGGCRQYTHRPPNRRANLRACRSRSVHAA